MKKNRLVRFTSGLVIALLMAGCNGQEERKEEEILSGHDTREILRIADTQSPTSLDPAQSWDSWYTSRWGITETLFRLDENLEPQPYLVERYEMIDPTTWKLVLKEDITFHNGKVLNAEAVKLSWERTKEINARFEELTYIEDMTAEGLTLTVITTDPVPAFINALAEPITGIIDVTSEENPAIKPIGTGPFQAVSYEVRTRAEVEKYDEYWGGEPEIDGAEIRIIGDTSTLAMAQQSGEIDVSVSMPSTSLELFSDAERYNVQGVPGSRAQILFLNFEKDAIKELAVRKALSMIIDKESYAKILNKNASVKATGLYPDFMDFGATEGYAYNMEEAMRILDDAGITDSNGDGVREIAGENISLKLVTYSTKAELPNYANSVSSAAKEAGIEILVEVHESVSEYQKSGDFDLMLVSFTMVPTGDPQYFANIAFRTEGSSNYGKYSSSEVDQLIAELETEFDKTRRTEKAKMIQEKILEDAAYIVIGHAKYYYVMNEKVKGLHTNPSEYYLLDAQVSIEK